MAVIVTIRWHAWLEGFAAACRDFAGGKSERHVFGADQRKRPRFGTVQPVSSGEAEPNPGGLVTE